MEKLIPREKIIIEDILKVLRRKYKDNVTYERFDCELNQLIYELELKVKL